jgi:hypothetical protein
LANLAASEPVNGQRHVSLWKSAKSLSEAGIAFESALDILTVVNDSWSSPKSASEVEEAVRAAYA